MPHKFRQHILKYFTRISVVRPPISFRYRVHTVSRYSHNVRLLRSIFRGQIGQISTLSNNEMGGNQRWMSLNLRLEVDLSHRRYHRHSRNLGGDAPKTPRGLNPPPSVDSPKVSRHKYDAHCLAVYLYKRASCGKAATRTNRIETMTTTTASREPITTGVPTV